MPTGYPAALLNREKDLVECAVARGLTFGTIAALYRLPLRVVERIGHDMDRAAAGLDTTVYEGGCGNDGGLCDRCDQSCVKRRGNHRHACADHR
jgi:hypothetical protein